MRTTARPGLPGWELPRLVGKDRRKKGAPLFRLGFVPCDPGWACGIEVWDQKLHYFCAIFASSNELRRLRRKRVQKLTVSLPFLDRNGGGCPANPC